MRVEGWILALALATAATANAATQTPLLEDLSMAFDLCVKSVETGTVDQIALLPSLVMPATSVSGTHGALPNGRATVVAVIAPQPEWSDDHPAVASCSAWSRMPPHDESQNIRVSGWGYRTLAAFLDEQPTVGAGKTITGHWCPDTERKIEIRITSRSWHGFEFRDAAGRCVEGKD